MNGRKFDLSNLLVIVPVICLIFFSVLVIYSSDSRLALLQIIYALAGILIFWLLSQLDVNVYQPYIKYCYFFIIFLLLVVFIVGIETRGSLRWIPIGGFNLQPSEFAKPIIILLLADFWSKSSTSWKNIFKSLLWTAPAVLLIFIQPDLGTALTIMIIWLMSLVGANLSLVKLFVMGLLAVILGPLGWLFLHDYQKNRLISFLAPEKDPLGNGYNVIQAMIAVGSGGLLGRGLGRGTQSRLRFLPEFRTDFMFASIAEEFGLLGSMIVLLLYGLILGRLLFTLSKTGNRFANVLILGVVGMIFFQVIVNVGMNVGLAPVTGITLPLVSYGGSSLISTLICLSLALAVSSRNH